MVTLNQKVFIPICYKLVTKLSKRIYVTVTDKQNDEITKLVGVLGNSSPDVISTIVAIWLYENSKKRGKE